MYSIIMKRDLPVPPTLCANINILNELHFPHMLPHVAKKNVLETVYVPKISLLDSSPPTPAQAGLYYMFVFLSKSLNSGLTSRHSTFSDIILTFVSTIFPARKKINQ